MNSPKLQLLLASASLFTLIACESRGSDSDSMPLFKSIIALFAGPTKTTNIVNKQLGAALQPLAHFPDPIAEPVGAPCNIRTIGVSHAPSEFRAEDLGLISFGPPKQTVAGTGYVITGMNTEPFVIANLFVHEDQAQRVRIWRLAADGSRPTETLSTEQPISPSTMSIITQVECLSPSRLLVGVSYHVNNVQREALCVLDSNGFSFRKIADVTFTPPDLRNFFSIRRLNADTSLVLYYSDRRRQSMDVYHNYYNHIRLMSPDNPSGVELLKLGIDTGNIQDWAFSDGIVYLKTIDTRPEGPPREGLWSLDITNAIQSAGGHRTMATTTQPSRL